MNAKTEKARTRRSTRKRTEAVSGCHDRTQPVPYRGMRLLGKRTVPSPTTPPSLTACDMWTFDGRSTGTRSTPSRATLGHCSAPLRFRHSAGEQRTLAVAVATGGCRG